MTVYLVRILLRLNFRLSSLFESEHVCRYHDLNLTVLNIGENDIRFPVKTHACFISKTFLTNFLIIALKE